MDRNVDARGRLDGVQGGGDRRDGLVVARVGDAHDGDDADGVLVDVPVQLEAIEGLVLLGDGHVAGLDLEVVGELLPADLDGRAHDDVGRLGGLAGRPSGELPAALERQAAEHAGLG